jgi:hypothetical protein
LVQNWIVKGCPAFSGDPKPSYVAWTQILGGILEAAGFQNFLHEEAVVQAGGTDETEVTEFLLSWEENGKRGVPIFKAPTARELLDNLVAPPIPDHSGNSRPPADPTYLNSIFVGPMGRRSTMLGNWLSQNTERQFACGLRIFPAKYDSHAKINRYELKRVRPDGSYEGVFAAGEQQPGEPVKQPAVGQADTYKPASDNPLE